VTHAGTHEISLIDAPILPQKPVNVRTRIPLPGNGPRAVAAAGSRIFVANYFSDNLCSIDLREPQLEPSAFELAPSRELSVTRRGEALFNDATLCYQQWQSCASCHDADARVDALNWDLLNDGQGNPKNAKSLLWAHRTPPAMALGIRKNAEVAVRAGIRYILFSEQPDSVPAAIDEYLKSLEPVPSPHLVNGRLSAAAERGKALFMNDEVGCARCHPEPLLTDLRKHHVGTLGENDQPQDRFDTPTLVELWRTAPYLHDGSAATLRDVLTTDNRGDHHGKTSHLTRQQVDDLATYLLSL
jgi:cytochrome c peroxidase